MKNRKKLFVAGVVLALVVAGLLFVRDKGEARAVASIEPIAPAATNAATRILAPQAAAAPPAAPAAVGAPLSPRGTKTVRVTADRTMTEPLRRTLSRIGARVIASVGPRSVLVEATPAVARRIAKDIRFTTDDILPAAKIQSNLSELCAAAPADPLPIVVIALTAEDVPTVSAAIVAAGGEIVKGPYEGETLGANATPALVAALSERGDVRWIEHAPPARVMNDQTVRVGAANVDTIRTAHKLFGRGETVTVCDSGFDTGDKDNCHLDFTGRVKAVLPSAGSYNCAGDYGGHGTHVSGTILGDGTRSDGLYKGMAPKAELVMECVGDRMGSGYLWFNWSYSRLFTEGLDQYGSYIHSDSWGSTTNGIYNSQCAQLDQVLWSHPELLVVFSAGNSGSLGDGWIGTPGSAKGALTVGNAQSFRSSSTEWGLPASPENLNPTSSRGPTADGRIKPEITAPGTAVYSTRSSLCSRDPISDNEYYIEMTGTSMACPLVAGAAALTREWLLDRRDYEAQHGGRKPTGALLKAILTGGGVIMTGEYADYIDDGLIKNRNNLPQTRPNTCTGWGRLDLENTLYPADGRNVIFADRIPFSDGATWVTNITTTADNALDVQLAWIDYPADASVDRGTTLINDLDLIVSNKTTGACWYGNDIEGGDHTNTTESVRIATAAAGEYVVMVRGTAVPHSSASGGAAAVYVRGAVPNETKDDPLNVRNTNTSKAYEFLEEALAEVGAGETLQILKPVELTEDVTLGVSCTLYSADPNTLAITRTDGASITLAPGVTLTVQDAVFADVGDTVAVTVSAGACLQLYGTAGVGKVAVENATAIQVVTPTTLAGAGLSVDAPNGYGIGEQFGTFSGDQSSAAATAAQIFNVLDDELGGIAVADGMKLVWGVVPCDPSIARCSVEIGGTTTYCRSFSQALKLVLAADEAATVTVKKSSTITSTTTLPYDLTLVGDGGSLSFGAAEAGFVVPAGKQLVLRNITVSGGATNLTDCAFKVTGGALTLGSGTSLSKLSNADNGQPYGGAVAVTSGSVTMESGSRIENCVAHPNASGGGIYVSGNNATANLSGGTITGCSALSGGAVYARLKATVSVSGDFTATGSKKRSGSTGNLFLARNVLFQLADTLSGNVGVSFGKSAGTSDLNLEGTNFITVASGDASSSAPHFLNDADSELKGAVRDGEIVWARTVADGQCEESEAKVFVTNPDTGAATLYYKDLNIAFKYVDWDATFSIKNGIKLTNTVTIAQAVRLEPYDAGTTPVVYRSDDAMYKVTGSLTVANVELWGYCDSSSSDSTVGLVSVDGGSLTLEEGALVGHVDGYASRASNAITVFNGGTVTMKSGSKVAEVDNEYMDDYETSCGGGIFLDHATGFFEGGLIYNCKAYRGGGLYVANGSTAYVSGDIFIGWNTAHKYDAEENHDDNVIVSKNSKLILAGLLSCLDPDGDEGNIGVNEGMAGDTSCFATVDWEWTDFEELKENAETYFCHDRRGVGCTAVTNWNETTQRWDARLVWEDSLSLANGITIDGTTYRSAIPAGMTVATPTAFSVTPTTGANGKQVLNLDGGVEGCWYTVYSTTDLTTPFTAEESVQLKPGETFEYEIDQTKTSKYYKVVAEEGLH